MNVRLLESFHTVAQEGNITRAATRLRLTQQTLSAQIKQLERALGAVLLVRDSRGVRLTAAGEILTEGAGAMLAGLAELSQRVNHAAEQPINRLRVVFCPPNNRVVRITDAPPIEAAVVWTSQAPQPLTTLLIRAIRAAVEVNE
ncbi:LysR family transcriptional regulator [Nocardia acidivorans]|uniref:LysR family transcriptional regulator n=1 Tax=Nocardia acidivorans TaxID=404580 RepID=UPI0008365BE8|nr:LysR family transcriptional regulator [Nocardia acidivorans]